MTRALPVRSRAMLLAVGLVTAACAGGARPPQPVAPAPQRAEDGPTSPAPVATLDAPRVQPALATTADVARSADAVFGAPPDAPTRTEGDGPTWDIDVRTFADHSRVSHYLDVFSTSAKARIASRLSRGTRYEPMIRAKLRAGRLPEDLFYLALVESGFDPDAYSRSAAVGMWQFMTTTAKGLGLRVDPWIDERRDPLRATDAAVRFLNGLNDQFGSLYLAAAAYNGGPGRVARGLRKYDEELSGISGDSLFFALADQDYLRAETKNYVPQIIAAAMIGKDPQRYGVRVDTQPPFTFDTVRVVGGTPLAAVARAAGVAPTTVGALNPHFLRGVTPPGASAIVRVPVGGMDGFPERFASLDSADRAAWRVLKTQKGETAAQFAARAGVPARTLGWFGAAPAKARKGRLVPGQAVRVPTSTTLALVRDVPDPSIERYGPSPRGRRTHVVRRGEGLSAIARRYGTSSAALMRLNGLRKPVVYAGQTLVVRGTKAKGTKAKGTKVSRTTKASKASKATAKKPSPKKQQPTPKSSGRNYSTTPRPR